MNPDPGPLAELFGRELALPGWRRALALFAEAAVLSALALLLAHQVGVPQGGFLSIFLAAAGLAPRLDQLLEENRRNHYDLQLGSWHANLITSWSLLIVFLGMITAYSVAAAIAPGAQLAGDFGFALQSAGVGADTLFSRRMGSASGLLRHNVAVLLTFAAMAFLYRSYGALLALGWNACLWGVVLTLLVRRAFERSSVPPLEFFALSLAAVLPHLILEAAAYVLASLGGIFLSKGLTKYGLTHPLSRRVARAVAIILLVSLVTLAAAAGVESTLPELVLAPLR